MLNTTWLIYLIFYFPTFFSPVQCQSLIEEFPLVQKLDWTHPLISSNSPLSRDSNGGLNLKEMVLTGQLLKLSQNGQLYKNLDNPTCVSHMTGFLQETEKLNNTHVNGTFQSPTTWALQMLDAWGGFPDGILSGHTFVPGDFPECLQIRGTYVDPVTLHRSSFKGRYSTTYIVPNIQPSENSSIYKNLEKARHLKQSLSLAELLALMGDTNGLYVIPIIGHCFPSSCITENVVTILTNALDPKMVSSVVIYTTTDDPPELDTGDISMIIVLSIIVGLCGLGTSIDLYFEYNGGSFKTTQSTLTKSITAFSLYANTMRWLNTKSNGEAFGCLHGLRFLSMCWVILFHTFLMLTKGIQWNVVDIKKMYAENWTTKAIHNGYMAVDTFFTISGALAAYTILRTLEGNKGRLNVLRLYLHRYIRLTPPYIILVGMMATIYPYIANGPQWYRMLNDKRACLHHWWHNALYITNFIKYTPLNGDPGPCFGEAWYLSNDMQFFILAPFVVYPLWRWRKIGFGLLGILSIASIVTPAVITGVKDLPPTLNIFRDTKTFEFDIYTKPWTRISPYLVGIFLGYLLYSDLQKKQHWGSRIPKWMWLVGWFMATGTALSIIFGINPYFDPTQETTDNTRAGAIAYAGLHRFAWGLVIFWIIYACVNGYGGWINNFLSWTPFIPLGRLSYCMYISSLHLQLTFHATTMHPWYYTKYIYVNMFFAHLVLITLVGFLLSMTLESPFIQLEKLIFQQSKPKPRGTGNKSDLVLKWECANSNNLHSSNV